MQICISRPYRKDNKYSCPRKIVKTLCCFAVYADALIHHEQPEHTSHDKEEVVVHRRMSLPESKGQDEGEDKRSSTGDYCVPITTPHYPGVQSVDRGMFIEHLQ